MNSIKEDVTLLPCPCCSSEDVASIPQSMGEYSIRFYVQCGDCCLKTGHYRTETEAITAWNTRSTSGLGAKAEGLAHEARFLCDRLNEMDWSQDFEDFANDFNGHVDPPFSRLKKLLDEWDQYQ